jgi:hypothetical protein
MMRAGRSAMLVLLLAGMTAACFRPVITPITPPPYRGAVAAPYDATWKALIRALALENVPLRAVAKDSGVVASDDFFSPIGVYADCGRLGDSQVEGQALVAFTIFVQPNGSAATDVQVNSKMRSQAFRRGASGSLWPQPVYECASTGRWEANLLDTVRRLSAE